MTVRLRQAILRLAIVFFGLWTATTIAHAGDKFIVSLHNADIASGERIIDFEIRMEGAMFTSLRVLPWDWELAVVNLAAAPKITGGTSHGAGALDGNFFTDFMTIESTGLAPLSLSGEITVTRDFSDVRRVNLQPQQFSLRKP